MKAPDFWWRPAPTAAAFLLQPAGSLYGAITAARMARPGTAMPVPVVCVGNFVAGGAGKTPTALALAAILSGSGHRPAFLSRGFGRSATATTPGVPIWVDPDRHDADAVGDEPLLLAEMAPTYVSRDRVAAGRRAAADGATVLVMDDGLQNHQLQKSVSVAVVDGAAGIGNGLCVPAGPLRAPISQQWPHVSAVLVIGPGEPGEDVGEAAARRGLPVWLGRLKPDANIVAELRGTRLHAFAGIGRPEKFFTTLREAGLDVVDAQGFPDHHRFKPAEIAMLRDRAARQGARLVTTAKDRARLPNDMRVAILPVTLALDQPAEFASWLLSALARGRA